MGPRGSTGGPGCTERAGEAGREEGALWEGAGGLEAPGVSQLQRGLPGVVPVDEAGAAQLLILVLHQQVLRGLLPLEAGVVGIPRQRWGGRRRRGPFRAMDRTTPGTVRQLTSRAPLAGAASPKPGRRPLDSDCNSSQACGLPHRTVDLPNLRTDGNGLLKLSLSLSGSVSVPLSVSHGLLSLYVCPVYLSFRGPASRAPQCPHEV